MTGVAKARSQTRQAGRIFIDSSGRTYPISSYHHTSSHKTPALTATETQARIHRKTSISKHNQTSSKQSSDGNGHIASISSPATMALSRIGSPDPQIESSRTAGTKQQAQVSVANASFELDSPRAASPPPESSAYPGLSHSISGPATGGKNRRVISRSPAVSHADKPAPSLYAWPNTDNASMHSDQDFDLGYKGKPAKPFCHKMHTRVWSSVYTRAAEDYVRELLEVRYPVRAETGNQERSALLGGWRWGLRSLWMRNL